MDKQLYNQPQPEVATRTAAKLTLFVVEDDEYCNQLITRLLQNIGKRYNVNVQVVAFYDGATCLQHLHENPDAIFVDYYLTEFSEEVEMTGLDVLDEVKRHNSRIKTIIISQKENPESFMQDLKYEGAFGFIKKNDKLEANLERLFKAILAT